MDNRRVSIGIIGTGGYGGTARQYLRNTGAFDIVACLDHKPAAARAAAAEEGAMAYTDLEAFLAHPGMEAVSINTPVLLHAEHSLRALRAGKHVFVTKPVAICVKDALAVKALACKKGLAYMVGHHTRHLPYSLQMRKELLSGRLGRVCNGMVTCCSSTMLGSKKGDWRTIPGKNPGGPMLQCGIHLIDMLIYIFGPVRRVMAMMQDHITPFNVTDNTLTILEFANGVQIAFVCNYATAYMHSADFFGTNGNLHFHHHITGLGQCELYFQPRASGVHEPWQALLIPGHGKYPDAHLGVLENEFVRQMRAKKHDYRNLDDSIQALRVVEAAVESHRTGKAVCLKQAITRGS